MSSSEEMSRSAFVSSDNSTPSARSFKKISVIVPTKNSSHSLALLLESLKNQTFKNFEVLVLDSKSTDNTGQIAQKYGAKLISVSDEHITENFRDISKARNVGAKESTGEYLFFVDSDMELQSSVLESCLDAIERYDALNIKEIVVTGDYWSRARALEATSYYGTTLFEAARFFKREVFLAVKGYDENLSGLEDLDMQASLLEQKFKIGWVDTAILHHESSSNLINYLNKRKRDGTVAFASKRPEYWHKVINPINRVRPLIVQIRKCPDLSTLSLLPGIFLLRIMELIVRRK